MEKKRVISDIIWAVVILVAAFFIFNLLKSPSSPQASQSVDGTKVLQDYITSTIQPAYVQLTGIELRSISANNSEYITSMNWKSQDGAGLYSSITYDKEKVLSLSSIILLSSPGKSDVKSADVLLKKYLRGNYTPTCSRTPKYYVCEDFRKGDSTESGAGVAYRDSDNTSVLYMAVFSCEYFKGSSFFGTGSCLTGVNLR